MSVCVQIIWRQVYEAHDMCMSVWTVSVSNSSHVGGCALCGQVESKECHYCETVNLHSCGWSFHLVEKNWLATYKSLTHCTASCPSFLLKQKSILCFTFIFLGYHSKEIPCHHCKYFRFIFRFPTFCLFCFFFNNFIWKCNFSPAWSLLFSSFVLQKSVQTPGMSEHKINLKQLIWLRWM